MRRGPVGAGEPGGVEPTPALLRLLAPFAPFCSLCFLLIPGHFGYHRSMVQVVINGEPRLVPEATSLRGLLGILGVAEDRVAIEHNGEIARRPVWDEVRLGDGDRLEIVQFVGGG